MYISQLQSVIFSSLCVSRPRPSPGEEDATNIISTAGKTAHEDKSEEINAEIKTQTTGIIHHTRMHSPSNNQRKKT